MKPVTTLIAPRIHVNIPLLQDILPTLAIFKLQGYDTWQQEGLQIINYMDIMQAAESAVKVIKQQEWAEVLANKGLTNMFFMPHFVHSV